MSTEFSSIQGALNDANSLKVDAESGVSKALHTLDQVEDQDKIAAIKSLRITINLAISEARSIADVLIKRGLGGRELSLSITNLQQARQWAGEALGEIGLRLPEEYRDGTEPASAKKEGV